MKRLLICFFAFFPLAIMAQPVVPMKHFGCELGKTSRFEAKSYFQKKGYVLISEQKDTIVYKGTFRFNQYSADQCILTLADDTIFRITLFDEQGLTNPKNHQKLTTKLNSEYGILHSHDYPNISLMLTQSLQHFATEAWSRFDNAGRTIVYSCDKQTGQSILLFENYVWYINYAARYIKNTFDDVMKDNPDFDKKNKVSSVAGVQFGEEYYQVLTSLNRKFSKKGIPDKQNSVVYFDVMIGGIEWKIATFIFNKNKQLNRDELCAAKLECVFPLEQYKNALRCYELVRNTYANKYTNQKCMDKAEGEIFCAYGMYQTDYNFNPPIIVELKKGNSRGGDVYYYVEVTYFILRLAEQFEEDI